MQKVFIMFDCEQVFDRNIKTNRFFRIFLKRKIFNEPIFILYLYAKMKTYFITIPLMK